MKCVYSCTYNSVGSHASHNAFMIACLMCFGGDIRIYRESIMQTSTDIFLHSQTATLSYKYNMHEVRNYKVKMFLSGLDANGVVS